MTSDRSQAAVEASTDSSRWTPTAPPSPRRPPEIPLGSRVSLTFEVQYRDARRRSSEDASDIIGRWVIRYVRRTWPAYAVEGWSCVMAPGRTYVGWWFGSVEVYVKRLVG